MENPRTKKKVGCSNSPNSTFLTPPTSSYGYPRVLRAFLTFLEIFENFDTLTVNRRFENRWICIKIPVFRTSFLRISALEITKIMIFTKKWSSGVYLYPMYPYTIKKVFRKSTSRFLRGWLLKKIEKKCQNWRGVLTKKSMVLRGSKFQIVDLLLGCQDFRIFSNKLKMLPVP